MKITAVFLRKRKHRINNNIELLRKKEKNNLNYKQPIYLILLILLIPVICNIGVKKDILKFATNFRQADNNQMSFKDLVAVYNIFNESNYVINKSGDNKKEKKENMTEYEIIDALANEALDSEVLAKSKPKVEVTENSKSIQRISINQMKILNYSTKRDIDYNALFEKSINLAKKSDKILLYNTHTSESYANSDKFKFDYTGTARTTDGNFNMLFIAKTLNSNLLDKGFDTIQNTTPHDYGTYTSAYSKSRITVKDAIYNMGGAGISIDVHRDASADLSFRPVVNIKGVQVAQLMFVMGVGNDTSKNPYYEDNLALALQIQNLADKIYPGLFRPMIIRNSVYNQDLNKYSLLVEVGATGNTIEEAMLATRCLSNLLNIIYKD